MKAVNKFLIGAAAVAVTSVGFAAPAAAQYYPPYGGGSGNVIVGAILDTILRGGQGGYGGQYGGYNRGYNYQSERYAIDQCARAAEARLNGNYGGYGGYGNTGYGNYGQNIRVNQIERVELTRNGNTKVYGWAGDAGWRGNYGGYYGNSQYNGYYGNATAPQYRWSCKVNRNTGRVSDVDINRGQYGYNRGYRY